MKDIEESRFVFPDRSILEGQSARKAIHLRLAVAYLPTPYGGIFVYNISLISISNSVSDRATNK